MYEEKPSDPKNSSQLYNCNYAYTMESLTTAQIGSWINYTVGVIRGVAVAVILELVYRFVYLKNLPTIELDELPAKYSMVANAMNQPASKNIIIGVLGILIPILLVINAFQTITDWNAIKTMEDKNGLMLILASIAIGAAALMGSVVCLTALSKQRKGEK